MRRLVLSALLAASTLAAPPVQADSFPANWKQPAAPFHVIDTVYYVGTEGISAWIIRTPAGLILLDGGVPEAAPLVEANIKALDFVLSDVKILLNSHAHFDHSGALAKLKSDTGARLAASQGDRFALEHGVYPGSESIHAFDFPPVKVDRVLADGDRVELGGVTLTVVLTPGHSAGCTGFTLPVADKGVTHTAFFFCSASVAANRLAPKPQYPGIVDDYRRTFVRLKTIHADVLLAPHAEFFDLKGKRARLNDPVNPFIVPGELDRLTATMETEFARQLALQTGKAPAP
jgi:metallo-beta-lactamase class B